MKTAKEILINNLQTEKSDLKEHEIINNSLIPFEGKAITKRVLKVLPDGFDLDLKAGMIRIKSNTGKIHLVAYNTDPVYNSQNFDKFDSPYFEGAKTRIFQIEGFLNDQNKLNELTKVFVNVRTAWERFTEAAKCLENSKFDSFNNPCYYELLRNYGVPSQILSDIKFSKFD